MPQNEGGKKNQSGLSENSGLNILKQNCLMLFWKSLGLPISLKAANRLNNLEMHRLMFSEKIKSA